MTTKELLLFISLFAMQSLSAQTQLDVSSIYTYNWQIFNPAAFDVMQLLPAHASLGKAKKLISVSTRVHNFNENINIEGSPNNQTIRYEQYQDGSEGEVKLKFGGFIVRDAIGPVSTHKIQGLTSIVLQLEESENFKHFFSGGISAGVIQHDIDASKLRLPDGSSGMSMSLPATIDTLTRTPSLSLGIFYTQVLRPDRKERIFHTFYAGFSMPQAIDSFKPFGIDTTQTPYYINFKRHYCITTGARFLFRTGNTVTRTWSIEPNIWVRFYDGSQFLISEPVGNRHDGTYLPFTADLNVNVTYEDMLWLGVGVSGFHTAQVNFGFSYQYLTKQADSKSTLDRINFAFSFPFKDTVYRPLATWELGATLAF